MVCVGHDTRTTGYAIQGTFSELALGALFPLSKSDGELQSIITKNISAHNH